MEKTQLEDESHLVRNKNWLVLVVANSVGCNGRGLVDPNREGHKPVSFDRIVGTLTLPAKKKLPSSAAKRRPTN